MTSSPEDNNQSGVLMPNNRQQNIFMALCKISDAQRESRPLTEGEYSTVSAILSAECYEYTRAEPAKPLPAGLAIRALQGGLNVPTPDEYSVTLSLCIKEALSILTTHPEAAAVVESVRIKNELCAAFDDKIQNVHSINLGTFICDVVDFIAAKYPHIFKSSAQRG